MKDGGAVRRLVTMLAALPPLLLAGCSGGSASGTAPTGVPPVSWAIAASPALATGLGELTGVACVSATDCWAVGSSLGADGSGQPLIESYAGAGWSIVASPTLPTGAGGGGLSGVACAGPGECWAVGSATSADGSAAPLIERYAGTGWSLVSGAVPTAGSSGGSLSGIACVDAGDCWAVGGRGPGGGPSGEGELIEHYSGGGWSVAPSPALGAGLSGGYLSGVACPDASACWAVGTAVRTNGTAQPLIDGYSGGGWSAATTSGPTAGRDLSGVACSGADACWAVGTQTGIATATFMERYAGGGWSGVSGPALPTGRHDGLLSGVACSGPGDCWAVGAADAPSGLNLVLIARFAAGMWSTATSPSPAGGNGSILSAVTCIAPDDCWAVGNSGDSSFSGDGPTLIEHAS